METFSNIISSFAPKFCFVLIGLNDNFYVRKLYSRQQAKSRLGKTGQMVRFHGQQLKIGEQGKERGRRGRENL